ncbi:MAG: 30S ribosomal protein S3 [Patescibacteria group bacterium]
MGQKISPYTLRLGINEGWYSRWFFPKNSAVYLEADCSIRNIIAELFPKSGIGEVIIERKSPDTCRVIVKTAKPGFLIGREGQNLRKLQERLDKSLTKLFEKFKLTKPTTEFQIEEIKKPFTSARVLAQFAAAEIEKRISVRRVMKGIIEKGRQNKEIGGIKIRLSGRLNGAEIHRTEALSFGKLTLGTLKSKIDYAAEIAKCTYGIVGIKVWLYKGESTGREDVTA